MYLICFLTTHMSRHPRGGRPLGYKTYTSSDALLHLQTCGEHPSNILELIGYPLMDFRVRFGPV